MTNRGSTLPNSMRGIYFLKQLAGMEGSKHVHKEESAVLYVTARYPKSHHGAKPQSAMSKAPSVITVVRHRRGCGVPDW